MTKLHKQNYSAQKRNDRTGHAKLVSSEEKLTEWQLLNYSTQKVNNKTAQAKLPCSVEKLTELQLCNSTTADNTFKKSVPI